MADNKNLFQLRPGQAKFLNRAATVREEDIFERNELGFSTRIFVQCNLPHRNPGIELTEWTRRNGNLCVTITPLKYINKDGVKVNTGYPYGNIPRLLLFYVCTQAIQTKKKEISLGHSLSSFMRRIKLEVTGGKSGTINRFKDQFDRLFKANIDFVYDSDEMLITRKANIASATQLWWSIKYPDQGSLFESYIVLTEEFYNELMTYPVPVDIGIVSAIKQSPLALDLYTWLTHRLSYLDKPVRISWETLSAQVGAEYVKLAEFARNAREAIVKIHACWPELKIDEIKGGIILKPSKSNIPTKLSAIAPNVTK